MPFVLETPTPLPHTPFPVLPTPSLVVTHAYTPTSHRTDLTAVDPQRLMHAHGVQRIRQEEPA